MNGAPDWQDGECCFRCRSQFSLVARKHHCRNCGNIFCAKCSSQQIPLPKMNIEKSVRVCDTCYEKIVGKSNDNSLALALGTKETTTSKDETKPKQSNSSSKSSSGSASGSKPAANASAPSEQELKEEEELQLALALSLSETPTKVSFPDCRHFEVQSATATTSSKQNNIQQSTVTASSNNSVNQLQTQASISNNSINSSARNEPTQSDMAMANNTTTSMDNSISMQNSYPSMPQQQQQQVTPVTTAVPQQIPYDYHIPERDREVFRFVGEVQSTLEVFTNRLESCKLRNRPISNEAAIQSQFLRLNSEIQPKLSEQIKNFDEERADYERIQDKLSQIADARAALDALREEHQEKMRQQAAEADRLRQTQLATKLEAMRQKKSQMMQYQRELALQRIREQEMMLQQQQQPPQKAPATSQGYQVPPVSGQQQTMMSQQQQQQVVDPSQHVHQMTQDMQHQQAAMHQEWHQQQQQQQQPHTNHQHPLPDYAAAQQTSYGPPQYTSQQQIAVQPPPPPATTQVSYLPQQQQAYTPPVATVPAQVTVPPPQQQAPPSIDRTAIAQLERQYLPNSKPEEDTPLISFDD